MKPFKNLRLRIGQRVVRAYASLSEGWCELLSRSKGPLTHFDVSEKGDEETDAVRDVPRWSLLAAETWETAQSVIIRVGIPGVKKEDIDISIHGNLLRLRGDKCARHGEHHARLYWLMERAHGRFERNWCLNLGAAVPP